MHSFYPQIIGSFLEDINMGFPYFNTKTIAKLFTIQLVSATTSSFKKSAIFSFQRFLGFFHWAWDRAPGDKTLTMDVEPHLSQWLSQGFPQQYGRAERGKIKGFISRRNHIYLKVTSKRENNALYFIEQQSFLFSLAEYFQRPTGLCAGNRISRLISNAFLTIV